MVSAKLVLAAALVLSLAVVGGLYYVATRPSGPGSGEAQGTQQGGASGCGFWTRPGLALAYEMTYSESPGNYTDRDYGVIIVAGVNETRGEADVIYIDEHGMEKAIERLVNHGAIPPGEAPSEGPGMAMFILNRVLADPGLAKLAAPFDDYTLKYRFNYSDPDQVEDYLDNDPGVFLVPAPCNHTKSYVRALAQLIAEDASWRGTPRISVEEGGNATVLAYNVTITPSSPSDRGRASIHIEILRELLVIKTIDLRAVEANESEAATLRLLGWKMIPESVLQALSEGLGGEVGSLKIFPDSAVYAANSTLRLHIANTGDTAVVITGIELSGQSLDLAEARVLGDAYMGSHTGIPSIVVEPGGMATIYIPAPINVVPGAAYTVTIHDANGNVYTAVVYGI